MIFTQSVWYSCFSKYVACTSTDGKYTHLILGAYTDNITQQRKQHQYLGPSNGQSEALCLPFFILWRCVKTILLNHRWPDQGWSHHIETLLGALWIPMNSVSGIHNDVITQGRQCWRIASPHGKIHKPLWCGQDWRSWPANKVKKKNPIIGIGLNGSTIIRWQNLFWLIRTGLRTDNFGKNLILRRMRGWVSSNGVDQREKRYLKTTLVLWKVWRGQILSKVTLLTALRLGGVGDKLDFTESDNFIVPLFRTWYDCVLTGWLRWH